MSARTTKATPLLSAVIHSVTVAPPSKAPRAHASPEFERRPFGRGVASREKLQTGGDCLCARPKCIVYCRGCGYYRLGRIRMKCPQHPQVHFLYDVDACGQCKVVCYLDEKQITST